MIRVSDLLSLALKYINEYSADVQEDVQTGEVDAFGKEAKEDLLAHIDAAARMVAQIAPANLQNAKTLHLTKSDEGVGSLRGETDSVEPATAAEHTFALMERPDKRRVIVAQLPTDYMRLVYLLCDSLYRPITVLLPATHPTYAMQYCPIAGIGAGAYAPIGYQVDGTLEVHSVDEGSGSPRNAGTDLGSPREEAEAVEDTEKVVFTYLALPEVTGEGDNAGYAVLKDELKDVVAMQAAALYLGMNDNEKAVLAQQAATGMLNRLAES